jgi:DNA-binding PadR family transcriptional regulator
VTSDTPTDFLPLKAAHFHILLTVAEQPLHGYGIREEVDQRTGGRIVLAAGTLYETLRRLERDGLVHEVETPPEEKGRASSRWRFYAATELGREVLWLEVARLEADVATARAKLLALS